MGHAQHHDRERTSNRGRPKERTSEVSGAGSEPGESPSALTGKSRSCS